LLQDFGMHQVEKCVATNSLTLSEGLAAISGVELLRPFDPQRVSGIVSFRVPAKNLNRVYKALTDRQLICSIRGDAIRLSPHFYQAGKPLLEILDTIEKTIITI